jgi:hypothetical protein
LSSAVDDSTGCSRGLLQSTPSPAASTRLAVVRFFLRVEQLLDCTGLCSEAVLCGGGGYLSGCVGTMSTVTAAKRLIPLLDRVLVEKIVPPTRSAGGILLPETTAKVLSTPSFLSHPFLIFSFVSIDSLIAICEPGVVSLPSTSRVSLP